MGTDQDWRQVVLARTERIESELSAAHDGANAAHVRTLLESARQTATASSSLVKWWDGSQHEGAWLNVHEAEAELVGSLGPDELRVHSEEILKEGRSVLGDKDPRVQHLSRLLDGDPQSTDGLLAAEAAHVTRAVYDQKDESYAESRTFRNRLIGLTGIALVGIVLLTAATALWRIDLNPAGGTAIPVGWQTPLLISLFGAVGAFVSSIPALSQVQGTRNPFSLPLHQLLLKLTAGPLFAFFGILVLQAGVITELNPAATLLELLVWAAIFGSTQQAVTRLVDRRVRAIVGGTATSGDTATVNPTAPRNS